MQYRVYCEEYHEEILRQEYPKLRDIPLVGPTKYDGIIFDTINVIVYIESGHNSLIVNLHDTTDNQRNSPNRVDSWSLQNKLDNPMELLRFLVSIGAKIKLNDVDVTRTFLVKL